MVEVLPYVHRNRRFSRDVHCLDFHTAPGLCGERAADDDDDELMLNVLRCHLTY